MKLNALRRMKTPKKQEDVYELPNNLEHLKLLLISDTHLASKYDRLDILRYLYAKADELGVKHVLHSGDFTDGRSNRPEHIYELREVSYEGQVDYCVDKYPTFDGKTYAISGNHDDWWYKSAGSEIVKAIAKQRDDIIYLGPDVADLKIGGLKIRLRANTSLYKENELELEKKYKSRTTAMGYINIDNLEESLAEFDVQERAEYMWKIIGVIAKWADSFVCSREIMGNRANRKAYAEIG